MATTGLEAAPAAGHAPSDTLKTGQILPLEMTVTVEPVGEGTREVDDEGTDGDLLAPFGVSRHELSAPAEGRPAPTDASVDRGVDHVRVVRPIRGG